jgi:hypothetical protein
MGRSSPEFGACSTDTALDGPEAGRYARGRRHDSGAPDSGDARDRR